MVESLILLAPAGLIRPENFGRASRLVFTTGIIPERLLAWLTKRRLRQPIASSVAKRVKKAAAAANGLRQGEDGKENLLDVATQEAVDPVDEPPQTAFELEVISFVHWVLDFHHGFVPAFMSTVRHAPLMDQQGYWRQLAKRKPGTTAVLLGTDDTLIQRDDYVEDALPLIGGEENVFWRVVPGSHNFPFTHAADALERIYEFWAME